MAVSDVPIVGGLVGQPLAKATSRPAVRRFTNSMFALIVMATLMTWSFVFRQHRRDFGTFLVIPGSLTLVGFIGFMIRRAVVEVGYFGVRWGWGSLHFRIAVADIAVAKVYRTGIAFVRPGGSSWYLARTDWADFDGLPVNLAVAKVPIERLDRSAPLRSRMQGYGRALDIIMTLAAVGALAMLSMAAK